MTDKAEIKDHENVALKVEISKSRIISLMLEVYQSVLDGTEVFYCSTPITSGKRYLDWLERIGKQFSDIDSADKSYHELHFKEVIEPNRIHAQRIIQKLRKQTGQVVIDPTALPPVSGWNQRDWHFFWECVIEQYATTVIFLDGWQYSNGCVHEFWVAQKKGIPTCDENRDPLSPSIAIDMIENAVISMQKRGGSTNFLEETLQKIKKKIKS